MPQQINQGLHFGHYLLGRRTFYSPCQEFVDETVTETTVTHNRSTGCIKNFSKIHTS